MRKLLFILLGFIYCLLFAGSGERCAAKEVISASQLCIDRASDDEWRCEQEYNSDMNLPRVGSETTVPAVPCVVRSVISDAGRASAARTAVLLHAAGIPKETSCQKPFDPVAGPCAVDYYVYRLRRLLI